MEVGITISSILAHKTGEVCSITPEAMVFEAIQLMANKNIGALMVMSGGQLVGIVSERDYTRKVALKGKSSKATPVREIMLSPPICASPQHTVEECMRVMTENRVRHLPVMEGSKVVGVVSIGDLVNWIISAQTSTIKQLENYIMGQSLG